MLLIDTNTLYYAMGLSIHNSVDRNTIEQAIDNADEVGISSISFAEIISRYKNKAEIINSICSYLINHQIKLCSNARIPFKDDIVQKLSTINQANLDKVFQTLSTLKTNVESPFATVVFFIVLFSETIFERNIDPYNVPSCIFEFFSLIFKDSLGEIIPHCSRQNIKQLIRQMTLKITLEKPFTVTSSYLFHCVFLYVNIPLKSMRTLLLEKFLMFLQSQTTILRQAGSRKWRNIRLK